jgi:hypothetical protein
MFHWIEAKAVAHCSRIILTAPGALSLYQERFMATDPNFWQLINNGYDKVIFDQLDQKQPLQVSATAERTEPFVLLHSGVIYPSERDPTKLFAAIAQLKREKKLNANMLVLRLRATGHDHIYQPLLVELDITDMVLLEPPIPYKDALQEMFEVDGLLLLQASNCDYQIPAKAYEYIRVNKPILGLMPRDGDTGLLLQQVGISSIAPLNDQEQIAQALLSFVSHLLSDDFSGLPQEQIEQYSRQSQAVRFELLLNQVINQS